MAAARDRLRDRWALEDDLGISAAAAEAPTKPEEEKKVEEVEAGANLTELFVKLDDGVPSDAIESLCMDCR